MWINAINLWGNWLYSILLLLNYFRKTLVRTWEAAKNITEDKGAKFIAILQPVAFFGTPNIEYLNLKSSNDIALSEEYNAVYPLIQRLAADSNIDFIDLSSIYNNCKNCYIDFCHVGPQGHYILVNDLTKKLIKN